MPEPIVILTPSAIKAAMESLSSEEVFLLDGYASMGRPDQYSERATAWLIAHGHSGRAAMILSDEEKA